MPDQSIKYLHMVAHGTRDEDGRLEYIGAVQDVTARRLSEQALGKAQSELARVARVTALSTLTASIAHEVSQPLSGIMTNASTCLRMLAADPPDVDGARETARRTIRDGNRASDVIARVRALFTKKESATESVDLNEAAREVIALLLSELQRNRVMLQSELADDLPAVTGDRVQLQQVILNLLRNASRGDGRRARSPAAIADQNRTRGRRSCAPERAGCRGGRRPSEHGQAASTPSTQRRPTAWVSGSPSAVRSSRAITAVCGRSRTTVRVPPSRFPFPVTQRPSTDGTPDAMRRS